MNNIVALLRQVRNIIPNVELQKQIDEAVEAHDVVENIGRHKVGAIVIFKPLANIPSSIRAKVVRNYSTANGKILYDLALEDHVEGELVFNEAAPLRAVDTLYLGEAVMTEREATERNLVSIANQ